MTFSYRPQKMFKDPDMRLCRSSVEAAELMAIIGSRRNTLNMPKFSCCCGRVLHPR
jgi:hypothetical protein